MWKAIGRPKLMRVTNQLATKFRDMDHLPADDKRLREWRKDEIKKWIESGEFRSCVWASALCKATGKTYRLNGQHSSTVMAEMNGTLPNIDVFWEHYECDTMEDVASLYATFDSKMGVRNTGDINAAFACSVEALKDLPSRVVNVAVSGISYALWEDNYFTHYPTERASLLTIYPHFVLWLATKIGPINTSNRFLFRSGVVAAMLKTHDKAKADSTTFWQLVRDESGPDHRSPDRVLAKYLVRTTVATGRGIQPGKTSASTREIYVKCIHGWNAWRKKATTDLKFHASTKTPGVV